MNAEDLSCLVLIVIHALEYGDNIVPLEVLHGLPEGQILYLGSGHGKQGYVPEMDNRSFA